MGKKLDKMMKLRAWTIVFSTLLIIVLALIIIAVILLNTSDYKGTNKSFNEIVAQGDVEARTQEFDSFNKLYFFSRSHKNLRALFKGTIPNLKIVNSQEYKIELTTNSDIYDKLDIALKNNTLYIDFKEKYYNEASRLGESYGGLYVNCTEFDITVYAPIEYLASDAELNLDFKAPNVKTLVAMITGEVRQGRIYNIDSESIGIYMSGDSNVSISGKASEYAVFVAKHNSSIDASDFITQEVNKTISSRLFGLSSIKYGDKVKYSITDKGVILTAAMVLVPLLLLAGLVIFITLFLRQKKEIDKIIEQKKKERKILQNL